MEPERVRLPEQEVEDPLPRAKLHFADGESERIVAHLARIGLVVPIEESLVWTHRGTKLRSGLFGVEKRGEQISDADSRSKVRLICNLKPSNAVQRMIDGDLAQLPCSTQWNGLQLEHYEVLLLSSSDRQCFFYIFEMECSWQGALALDGLWRRELFSHVPSQVRGSRIRVALRALPMGCLSAVGVSQHAHRNLLRRTAPGRGLPAVTALDEALGVGVGEEHFDWSREVRRDRPLPQSSSGSARSAFQLYIDNLDEYEVVDAAAGEGMKGQESETADRSEKVYEAWKVPGNAPRVSFACRE